MTDYDIYLHNCFSKEPHPGTTSSAKATTGQLYACALGRYHERRHDIEPLTRAEFEARLTKATKETARPGQSE